ncbi:hypothetical protein L218DRAFT_962120 [Marasmius fiardii PR-910]|nr:hypothetical protein L218DRAFT_962120 [Marasmius fiardii PR-910]
MPTPLSAPSSSLPWLSRLSEHTASQISSALDDLCRLYWPPQLLTSNLAVPTRKHLQTIHDDSVPDSGYASAEEDELDDEEEQSIDHDEEDGEAVEILRADPFERTFAIKWITGFIARSDVWLEEIEREEDVTETDLRAEAVEKAVSILSAFNGERDGEITDGAAECASITRSFSFSSCDGSPDIRVELNDAPLSDEDHTSVGLQSWASSIVLAQKMCAIPSAFNWKKQSPTPPAVRILELGAGTGLLSITAAKILQRQSKQRFGLPPVVATDFHPAVLSNLAVNVTTNFPSSSSSPTEAVPISILRLDWEDPDYSLFEGQRFNIILAADVIYHPQHARWIKACVERLLTNSGNFWLMMPLRTAGRHENMDVTVEETFPDASNFDHDGVDVDGTHTTELAILERESFAKQRGVGRADEGGYRLFKIGWVPRP